MIASPAKFFGQDGARHDEGGHKIRRDAGYREREQSGQAMGYFQAEQDGGERNAERSGEHGPHADQGPERLRLIRSMSHMSRERSYRSADHEQRCKYAARGSRPQGKGPHQ